MKKLYKNDRVAIVRFGKITNTGTIDSISTGGNVISVRLDKFTGIFTFARRQIILTPNNMFGLFYCK